MQQQWVLALVIVIQVVTVSQADADFVPTHKASNRHSLSNKTQNNQTKPCKSVNQPKKMLSDRIHPILAEPKKTIAACAGAVVAVARGIIAPL